MGGDKSSDQRERLTKVEVDRIQLAAFYDAFVMTKVELSRRILTISSAAIGLIVTLGVNTDQPIALELKWMFGSALFFFVLAIGAAMLAFRLDPDYLSQAIAEIDEEGGSQKLNDLERQVGDWGDRSQVLFAVAVVLLLIASIITISKIPAS
jgi:hypothetical protein